jgi:hypothetical protein
VASCPRRKISRVLERPRWQYSVESRLVGDRLPRVTAMLGLPPYCGVSVDSFSRRDSRSYALWMLFRYRPLERSDGTLLNLSRMVLRGPKMASVCYPLSPPP